MNSTGIVPQKSQFFNGMYFWNHINFWGLQNNPGPQSQNKHRYKFIDSLVIYEEKLKNALCRANSQS